MWDCAKSLRDVVTSKSLKVLAGPRCRTEAQHILSSSSAEALELQHTWFTPLASLQKQTSHQGEQNTGKSSSRRQRETKLPRSAPGAGSKLLRTFRKVPEIGVSTEPPQPLNPTLILAYSVRSSWTMEGWLVYLQEHSLAVPKSEVVKFLTSLYLCVNKSFCDSFTVAWKSHGYRLEAMDCTTYSSHQKVNMYASSLGPPSNKWSKRPGVTSAHSWRVVLHLEDLSSGNRVSYDGQSVCPGFVPEEK